MKKFLLWLTLLPLLCGPLFCNQAFAFEIYALGTSATNCKGVDRDKIFTVRLQEILRRDGYDATVINGGIDGDRPVWMMKRLVAAITPQTRLVLFEPGPNDPDKSYAVEYADKILAYLQAQKIPTIYLSSARMQTLDQAATLAKKYGAYYYGPYSKSVPVDRQHWQFDNDPAFGGSGKGAGGHLTAEGCLMVATAMAPLVEQALTEKAGLAPRQSRK